MEDKRFENFLRDPKFRRIPKSQSKIKIDKRFESMFTDKKFQVKYTVDKRGRPTVHHSSEDLKRYYELSSDEDEKNDLEEPKKSESDSETDLNKPHENDAKLPDAIKKKLRDLTVDYARGESKLLSDSSSDDEESEDEETSDTDEIDHKWGELDADAASTEEITRRLAACNMDWDRIRAIDLMVLFSSFLPSGSVIESVVIYPSEFGKQRMKEEEVKGPIELVETKKNDQENEREEGSKYHMEKLRQYQLNRLKYYYAVVTFDDANSANKIYTECDGMEYESSATKIDLRFIPDDMEFTDEPKESCTKLPEAKKYEPRFFTTSALQQAKVNLTWDETDPGRIEFSQKINSGKLDSITDEDLQNYLAGSSDEEENEEEEEEEDDDNASEDGNDAKTDVEKYKALLKDIEEKSNAKNNKDVEMEVSWGIDLKEKTEKLAKQKRDGEKTPFEQYLEKRKEKRKEKREKKKKQSENKDEEEEDVDSDIPSDIDMNDSYFAEEFKKSEFTKKKPKKHEIDEQNKNDDELELLLMNEDNKKHFNLSKIQEQENTTKKKKKKNKNKQSVLKEEEEKHQDEFKVNVADERFSALFTSHHFNIDPTDPRYKKTKGMETLIGEKLKRRNDETVVSTSKKQKIAPKKNTELAMLVKSVKNKTKGFKNKRNA